PDERAVGVDVNRRAADGAGDGELQRPGGGGVVEVGLVVGGRGAAVGGGEQVRRARGGGGGQRRAGPEEVQHRRHQRVALRRGVNAFEREAHVNELVRAGVEGVPADVLDDR